jgi:hypothetical protein
MMLTDRGYLASCPVVFPEQTAFKRLTAAEPRFIELDLNEMDVDIQTLYNLHHDTFFVVPNLITPCKILDKPASLLYQTTLTPAQITARVEALHPDVRFQNTKSRNISCMQVTEHSTISSRLLCFLSCKPYLLSCLPFMAIPNV